MSTKGRAAAMFAAAALLVTAFGSSLTAYGADTETVPTGEVPDIFLLGGPPDDPFWTKVKRGAEDAEMAYEAMGGSLTYLSPANYDNLGPDAAKLIRNAIGQNAGAIVAPDWVPDAMNEALQAVSAAGIPLIVFNAGGPEEAQKVGSFAYIGTDEDVAGRKMGEYLASQGLTHALCINDFPGASFAESRCGGLEEAFTEAGGEYEVLVLASGTYGDQTAVTQAIKAAILKGPTIDVVVTLGVGDVPANQAAIQQSGSTTVKAATWDVDETSLDLIKDGSLLVAIDQQPYLQGFLAVGLANQHAMWGMDVPQYNILTGPAPITIDNVDLVQAGAAAGVR